MAYFNVGERIEIEAILKEEEEELTRKKVKFEKEYDSLVKQLQAMRSILDDAGRGILMDTSAYGWLKTLKETAYELEDGLDELYEEMECESNDVVVPRDHETLNLKQKVDQILMVCPSFLCFSSKKQVPPHHHQVIRPAKILFLKQESDQLLKERGRYNLSRRCVDDWTQFSRPVKFYGRDNDRESLVSALMPRDYTCGILSIVGVGGIGKTALARIVYEDARVEEFFELRIWICVSECGGIMKGIIKWVREGISLRSSNDVDVALERLIHFISGKMFLLVLDDVSTVDDTERTFVQQLLLSGRAGSSILVTTRIERVAQMMGSRTGEIFYLERLSEHDCFRIICDIAGPEPIHPEYIEYIAERLAFKCRGLPLNAMFSRGLLALRTYLEVPVDKLEELLLLKSIEEEMYCLRLVYEELPPTLQDCFSYCSIFPQDHVIDAERLIECWAARGYLGPDFQTVGRQYVELLAACFLIRDLERSEYGDGQIKRFKIHDLVHDFARSMSGRVEGRGTGVSTCEACSPSLVSDVKTYRSLFITLYDEPPPGLCKNCLAILRILSLRGSNFPRMPQEIENMMRLRWLELSGIKLSQEDIKSVCKLYKLQFLRLSSCNLKEIPSEIGNLCGLLSLDLSFNYFLKGLPESICCLVELRALNLDCCHSFSKLPQGIHKLTKLEHLHYKDAHFLFKLPQGLGSLTSLQTLTKFHGGRHLNELKLLRNLNSLSGSLELHIRLTDDLLEDAREARLKYKRRIQYLKITFYDYMDGKDDYMDDKDWFPRSLIIDALKPHEGLRELEIRDSNGSTIPSWIISPYNQLKSLVLSCFNHLKSLPPLGKLPHLEELCFDQMFGLRYVGPEFLGITRFTHNHGLISFPNLRKLIFIYCPKWVEWKDISTEEENALAMHIMPCLTELSIISCEGLNVLPLRLLRKASSLKVLDVSGSRQLQHNDEMAWESISQIPRLQIVSSFPHSD